MKSLSLLPGPHFEVQGELLGSGCAIGDVLKLSKAAAKEEKVVQHPAETHKFCAGHVAASCPKGT